MVIIDTGCANLSSVKFAFDRLGVNAIVSDDVYTIGTADKLILPGVGTASFAMQTLAQKSHRTHSKCPPAVAWHLFGYAVINQKLQ